MMLDGLSGEAQIMIGEHVFVDLQRRCVTVGKRRLPVTPTEFQILHYLLIKRGEVCTKAMIMEHLYGQKRRPKEKIIDVLVCKLRKKLADANAGNYYIETIWGKGFVIRSAQQ